MEAKDFISIYAAILATVVFFWNVRTSRSEIKVTLVAGSRGSNENLEAGVYLAIQNPSPHTVHVNSVLLLYPYRRVTFLQKIKHLCEFKRFSRYLCEAFNAHDLDCIMAFFSDDCVLELPRGSKPWSSRFEGKRNVREALATRFEGLPYVHYGNEEHFVDSAADTCISKWTLTGTTHEGTRKEVQGCHFYRLATAR